MIFETTHFAPWANCRISDRLLLEETHSSELVIEAVAVLGKNLIGLQWKGAASPRYFQNIRLRIRLDLAVFLDMSFENQRFPAAPQGIFWSEPIPSTSSTGLSFEFAGQVRKTSHMPPDGVEAIAETMLGGLEAPKGALVGCSTDLRTRTFIVNMHKQTAHDVCFVFPEINRELWASETILTRSSSYYETLLTLDSGEASVKGGSVRKPSDAAKWREFDDRMTRPTTSLKLEPWKRRRTATMILSNCWSAKGRPPIAPETSALRTRTPRRTTSSARKTAS